MGPLTLGACTDGGILAERRRHQIGNASNTFQAMAGEWIASRENDWSPSYRNTVNAALAANLYPRIGTLPVRSITVPILRDALLLMERRSALSALRKVRMWGSMVFRYSSSLQDRLTMILRHRFEALQAHKSRNFAA